MKRLGLSLLLLCVMHVAQAMPEVLREQGGSWRALGQGTMRWFGLALYTAELWTSQLAYDPASPFALKLTYARSFSGVRIASASVDEMRRIGIRDEAQLVRWQGVMDKLFPDVREGDTLTGVNLPGRGVAFYRGDTLLGEVNEPAFAAAFFGIWLDPRTREPGLRLQLIGGR